MHFYIIEQIHGVVGPTKLIKKADIGRTCSCPLLRPTCATRLLKGGAETRFIQKLPGNEKPETTAIDAQVSIDELKAVHRQTHPAESGEKGDSKNDDKSVS